VKGKATEPLEFGSAVPGFGRPRCCSYPFYSAVDGRKKCKVVDMYGG